MGSHHHEVKRPTGSRPLKIALGIVLVIMTLEVIGGVLSNSLALLSDAGHMLVDALALGLALFALTIAGRPATQSRTFGYHRAEILAALANGAALILISAYIFYKAYQRLSIPPEINTTLMITVAFVGLVANLSGILLLRGTRHHSLNIKAAFWHVIGDTISSAGVIVAGIIIAVTGWYVVDSVIAVLIGCIILWGAVRIVSESVDVLLEAVPKHIQVDKVVETMKRVPGVEGVDDIHIWTITSGLHALSAHLIIEDRRVSQSGEIMAAVNYELSHHFNITHTTLQLECEACPDGLICDISRTKDQT
ncbi:cation diffusion facilitator family transporter [Chloroflexota bacterium]